MVCPQMSACLDLAELYLTRDADRPLMPKASAASANTMIIAEKARLAVMGLASVEITPMPMTGSAFPQNTQMR